MIKAIAPMKDKDGEGRLLIIGLSAGNTQRLLAGNPITFELSELGISEPRIKVLIIGGETEEVMRSDLAEHFDFSKAEEPPA